MMNKVDLIQKTGLQYLFRPFYSGIGHIITLHRVSNESKYIINRGLQVSQDYLEDVIRFFISKKIDIVSLDECYDRITGSGKRRKFVVFTFDDGYVDNLTHALPVFEKYSAPFAVFQISGYPEAAVVMWWYLLEELVIRTDRIEFSHNGIVRKHKYSSMEEKRATLGLLKTFILESKSKTELLTRVDLIFANTEIDIFSLTKELSLTWHQIRELSEHPLVTIGAHTVNHLALSKLSKNDVVEEIRQSIITIENQIGKKIEYFSYPYGSPEEVGQREFEISNELNLKMAFTMSRGNIFRRHKEQLLSLPRIGLSEVWRMSHINLYVNGMLPALRNNF